MSTTGAHASFAHRRQDAAFVGGRRLDSCDAGLPDEVDAALARSAFTRGAITRADMPPWPGRIRQAITGATS